MLERKGMGGRIIRSGLDSPPGEADHLSKVLREVKQTDQGVPGGEDFSAPPAGSL